MRNKIGIIKAVFVFGLIDLKVQKINYDCCFTLHAKNPDDNHRVYHTFQTYVLDTINNIINYKILSGRWQYIRFFTSFSI